MSRVLPILFNTDMVRAILDGRKTVTRRIIKPRPSENAKMAYIIAGCECGKWYDTRKGISESYMWNPPCHAGDILYVRETFDYLEGWKIGDPGIEGKFFYRADGDLRPVSWRGNWRPSIHMPKEAARIWLKVKNVRVERLQDITIEQVAAEGIYNLVPSEDSENLCDYCPLPDEAKGVHCYGGAVQMCEGTRCNEAMVYWQEDFIGEFAGLWESTIKDKDIGVCGWDANPWVWVIEFERCEKPEGL